MTACIVGCQYIPSIEFFAHWAHHGDILIESYENFQKRSWRNKTAILGPEKSLILSVPLRKGKHSQMPITHVEISYDEPWHRVHFNSIQAAYGRTAFFSEIEMDLKDLYFSNPARLWEFNLAIIQFLIQTIPGRWQFGFTTNYESKYSGLVIDLRQGVPAGHISISLPKHLEYDQVHRLHNSHLPNLSILDVLCHLGPGTYDYLARYANQLYLPSC